ncbi:MAG: DNA alkylation repair protein [Paracoccaceae bacterium]
MSQAAENALTQIRAHADSERATGADAYHKIDRIYLGVSNPVLNDLTKTWRQSLDVPTRVEVATELWETNIYEARLAAAKLLTQARIRPDDDVWALIASWVSDFDSWAIADHACMAGQKRLIADPDRVEEVARWTTSNHLWTKRAALVITLPWAKQNHPKPKDTKIREQVLGWAASYVSDRAWFIQKAIGWWLRDLSKRDPDRVRAFLSHHSEQMKPFARKEAAKYL